ncbi:MAG: hypothetical protein ACP5K1_00180 [Candidatus Bathyarchaeia archaeon]
MAESIIDEASILDTLCSKISDGGATVGEVRDALLKAFSDRFERAAKLIEERAVVRYVFKPSGRIVWMVKGRKHPYQVIPATPYCSCDDFYFRVLGGKRGVCYHLIAQRLASALGEFVDVELPDRKYREIINKLRPDIQL